MRQPTFFTISHTDTVREDINIASIARVRIETKEQRTGALDLGVITVNEVTLLMYDRTNIVLKGQQAADFLKVYEGFYAKPTGEYASEHPAFGA